jgi:hypothetical protein
LPQCKQFEKRHAHVDQLKYNTRKPLAFIQMLIASNTRDIYEKNRLALTANRRYSIYSL